MPDHVHLLVRFAPDPGMQRVMAAWKRYTARHLGLQWQRDFFDHRLRNDRAVRRTADYIRLNPVRAGLIEEAAAWPYVWRLAG